MMKNLVKARTCIYNCNYHIVFSVKYRRKIFSDEISSFFKDEIIRISKQKDFIVKNIEIGEQDHVHVFVSAHPKISPSYIVKMIKGITGRKLFLEFPEIKNVLYKNKLWNPSFYIETIGSVSDKTIAKYIESQS